MTQTLNDSVARTHELLTERLRVAETSHPTAQRPHAMTAAIDPFLATASRHVSAANAVLGPAARRHLGDGRDRARALARQSRRLEEALFAAKSKLYGSSYAVRQPWAEVWLPVESELAAFWDIETELVDELAAAITPADADSLALELYNSETRVPTRPHPHLPHQGVGGRMARGVASRVDRFWDAAEDRMVPEPVHPMRHRDGWVSRYLMAEADVDEPDEDVTSLPPTDPDVPPDVPDRQSGPGT
ncbi:hypothetical protein JK386_17540 [Nocardioides sp. zg-536]|uniref:Uncharacterized protein n=1 Tax=Nocardioides faecalis TaxID=2803858 RepID=A0A938Y9C5_9ACTN|nr:hypothetical protein [Nocardioides faecalis]MBM9461705.1 hypothetical protein [Nocardioides faecalis]MBS4752121.1 hypothetical protein [Nocardioides faecalis]QVI59070.1 hypothetical protein KG111_01345 [Nocardioides faecalis]